MIQIIEDSIISSKEKYIAHQCNCITQNSAGTAKTIFEAFPYSDTYKNRVQPNIMPSIEIMGNGEDQRYVINMFAQYYPGKTKYPNSNMDGINIRRKAFHKCLLKISKIPHIESIAFPWKIGCNLAGGNWEWYYGTIKNFADYIEKEQQAKVVFYKLPDK